MAAGFVRIVNVAISVLHDELESKSWKRQSRRKREIIVKMVTICAFMTLKIHLLEENIKQLIIYWERGNNIQGQMRTQRGKWARDRWTHGWTKKNRWFKRWMDGLRGGSADTDAYSVWVLMTGSLLPSSSCSSPSRPFVLVWKSCTRQLLLRLQLLPQWWSLRVVTIARRFPGAIWEDTAAPTAMVNTLGLFMGVMSKQSL